MRLIRPLILTGLLLVGGSLRAETNAVPLVTAFVMQGNVAYLRVSQVAVGLAEELAAANGGLVTTNQIIGTVLDLRFAGGSDGEAVKPAAVFLAGRKLPLAILVNGGTGGAAGELARMLRGSRAGLVFGRGAEGIQPDIEVAVKPDEEKIYFADAFAVLTNHVSIIETNGAGRETNRSLPHVSEADLVRARRAGAADPEAEAEAAVVPVKPVVHDPVLARALDLLKGLAVVGQKRGD
jgi:hypothetical protein